MSAALPSPVTVGWSGMLDKKISRWFLKWSTCSEFILLNFSGSRLKMPAPLTPKDLIGNLKDYSTNCLTSSRHSRRMKVKIQP